jgi:hypothetical protein
LVWSPKLKFKVWVKSYQWFLRYSTLIFKNICQVWSPKLSFQIWVRSNKWLVKYSTLLFWGCLSLKVVILNFNLGNIQLVVMEIFLSICPLLTQFLTFLWNAWVEFQEDNTQRSWVKKTHYSTQHKPNNNINCKTIWTKSTQPPQHEPQKVVNKTYITTLT